MSSDWQDLTAFLDLEDLRDSEDVSHDPHQSYTSDDGLSIVTIDDLLDEG